MRRSTIKLAVLIGAGVILLVMFLAISIWRSPPFYTDFTPRALAAPIMTMAEYRKVRDEHARPYVVNVESANGAVLLYGASHTMDPSDPQIADIRRRWQTFEPTVALVEGRLGFLVSGLMDPVRHFGEMGAVNALARSDGVPVYSWEPPREEEIARMLEEFPAERVAGRSVLRTPALLQQPPLRPTGRSRRIRRGVPAETDELSRPPENA